MVISVRPGQSLPFTEPYRTDSLKIVVVITDAPPDGFDGNTVAAAARMHDVAVDSQTASGESSYRISMSQRARYTFLSGPTKISPPA